MNVWEQVDQFANDHKYTHGAKRGLFYLGVLLKYSSIKAPDRLKDGFGMAIIGRCQDYMDIYTETLCQAKKYTVDKSVFDHCVAEITLNTIELQKKEVAMTWDEIKFHIMAGYAATVKIMEFKESTI